jgi:hypothetical protein
VQTLTQTEVDGRSLRGEGGARGVVQLELADWQGDGAFEEKGEKVFVGRGY